MRRCLQCVAASRLLRNWKNLLELPLNGRRNREDAMLNQLCRLFGKHSDPREAVKPLWLAVVNEARQPHWYAQGGVEDSVTGRFDMVSMVTALVLLRMEERREMAAASALLTECFVEDMEGQLREFGVNDVVVGKRVGKLVGSLGGRLGALRDALPQGEAAVAEVVSRNMRLTPNAAPQLLARTLVDLAARLRSASDAQILAGKLEGGSWQ